MFCLVPITDLVIIKPKKFGFELQDVITRELNSRFSNKILYKVGLCISVWDITSIGDMYVSHDDGSYHVNASFRLICFRPSVDEVIIGSVKNCIKEGIQVSLNFFDDIFIPATKMKHPSKFDFEQQSWIWQYENEGEVAELRIEKNDSIRFRVDQEIWQDPNPTDEKDNQATLASFGFKSPYVILGSIAADGLGLTCWWIN
ncbi:unnamed protein product [Rodentolepis nana]|uniref:DNA-directed RNA polymerase III subunit RPC8 n=1 Tax=Rodentolepis nana TaxID=102285 RepID=A0A0R3T5V7_RODNA|nr:unnamed protein product [Rodentolepis nana]